MTQPNEIKLDPTIKIKKNYPDSIIPVKSNPTDSGFDLFAYKFAKLYVGFDSGLKKIYGPPDFLNESLIETSKDGSGCYLKLNLGDRVLVDTGISATVGPGYEIQIRPRSGLALKQGLTVLNTPGTIDESYRGMIGVILLNTSQEEQKIYLNSRIAQMVVCPVVLSEMVEVIELPKTERGTKGFGSSGTHDPSTHK